MDMVCKQADKALNNELALKSERERISKELHDDLGSGLTSLQIMVRRIMNKQPGNTQNETLHSIASVSEELIDQMSEVVWVLNNANDTVNGLLAHLRIYMADYIEKTGFDLSLEFNYTCKVNYAINNVLRRNLLLIIKEVFHNVIKHADASRFSLAASCEEKTAHHHAG
jgi:signal transduction histidine kinase